MTDLLDRAIDFLRSTVKPRSEDIDQDPEALRDALSGMAELGILALKRPEEYGGPAVSETDFRRFQEETARASGVLAFLQTQHQSAVGMLSGSENTTLKREYLPKMANGDKLVGIGFSQLRRKGPPIMRAVRIRSGYRLEGQVPWVTGWSFYPEFLVGATLPEGEAVFAIVPLSNQRQVRVSTPMRLAAMEAAMTVSVEFDGFEVADDRVAFVKPGGWIANNDMINIALQGHFAIGCSLGALDVLAAAYERRPEPAIRDTMAALSEELEECREETAVAQRLASDETTEERLRVRAWAIDLAFRCSQAAVVAGSGASNSLRHPAQRLYREALVYSVSAQTNAIMSATLARLTRCDPESG